MAVNNLWSLFAGLALVAECGGGQDSPTPNPGHVVVADSCGHVIAVQLDPFRLDLEDNNGVVRSSLLPGGFRVGSVPAVDPDFNYDPWYFYQDVFPSRGPAGLRWLTADRVVETTPDGEGLDLLLELSDGRQATLSISPGECPSAFSLRFEAPDVPTAYVGLDFDAPETERYYGLGEYLDSVEHRGRVRAMQFEVDVSQESGYNEAHVPVPLLVSTSAWGVFVADDHPGIFDVASTTPDQVRVEFGAEGLDFYWMAADHPREVVESYTRLTGAPAVPPVWAFAPVQWRDEAPGQAEVEDDARQIRANKLPGGGIWLDRPYAVTATSMDFDPARYPDPQAMVDTLHQLGFNMAGWCAPYLDPADPDWQEADANGWFVDGPILLSDFGDMVDYTHPDALAWWQDQVRDARERGFDGWKMDYGEDIQQGVSETAIHFGFYNGQDGDTMHHRYSDFYHRAFQEPYSDEGPTDMFLISRAGAWGGQKFTSVIWPGDLCDDYFYHKEDGHVGGLPAAMIAGMSLSASGFPFYASDTGGYRHDRVRSEVLLRWAQYSAFLPVMQYCGTTDDCNPWDFSDHGASTYTQETLDIFTRYARLHTELFPFFYSLAEEARLTGKPVAEAFGFTWPADGRHPNDQMVVGQALMVAPLVRGGMERTVLFPQGNFVNFFTGEWVQGPTEKGVQVPLDEVPLYLLEGAIVPMLRPGVETLLPTTDNTISSFANDPGRLWGVMVPGVEQSSRKLPFGEGQLWVDGGSEVTVGFAAGENTPRYTGVHLKVYAPGAAGIRVDGVDLPRLDSGEVASCTRCFAIDGPWLLLGLDRLTPFTGEIH